MATGFGDEMRKGAKAAGEELRESMDDTAESFKKSLKNVGEGTFQSGIKRELDDNIKNFGRGMRDSITKASDSIEDLSDEAGRMIDITEKETRRRRVNTNFSERRSADVTQRVIGSEAYNMVQERANTMEAIAQARNLPKFMRKLTEETAEWVRETGMGVRPLSYIDALTKASNRRIEQRLNMHKQEALIISERFGQEKSNAEFRNDEITQRLNKLNAIGELSSKQMWEQKNLIKRTK